MALNRLLLVQHLPFTFYQMVVSQNLPLFTLCANDNEIKMINHKFRSWTAVAFAASESWRIPGNRYKYEKIIATPPHVKSPLFIHLNDAFVSNTTWYGVCTLGKIVTSPTTTHDS